MKTVKKFATFNDLKSCESKATENPLTIRKHLAFEKTIKNMGIIKAQTGNQNHPK
jgi:hypothetical protein